MPNTVDSIAYLFTALAVAGLIVGVIGLAQMNALALALIAPALFIAWLIDGYRWQRKRSAEARKEITGR